MQPCALCSRMALPEQGSWTGDYLWSLKPYPFYDSEKKKSLSSSNVEKRWICNTLLLKFSLEGLEKSWQSLMAFRCLVSY